MQAAEEEEGRIRREYAEEEEEEEEEEERRRRRRRRRRREEEEEEEKKKKRRRRRRKTKKKMKNQEEEEKLRKWRKFKKKHRNNNKKKILRRTRRKQRNSPHPKASKIGVVPSTRWKYVYLDASFLLTMAHTCCDPLIARHSVAHRVSQQIPAVLEMWRGGVPLHPSNPRGKDPVAPILPPPCQCRGEISLQKRIALHGGGAATLTPIALHCATKFLLTIEVLLFMVCLFYLWWGSRKQYRTNSSFWMGGSRKFKIQTDFPL